MFRSLRFGTLSLFAAMLLVVSAAGWWKFHRDLYLEKQAVLANLAKEDCETLYSIAPTSLNDPAWSNDSKNGHFDRMQELVIWGSPTPETLRRAAMLPNQKLLEMRWDSEAGGDRTPSAPSASDLVKGAAPVFANPELVEADLHRPQATGERMSEADQANTLAVIRSSWETPAKSPQRFVRSAERFEFGLWDSRSRESFARDCESALTYSWWDSRGELLDGGRGQLLQIDDGDFLYDLRDASAGWRLSSRYGKSTRDYQEKRWEAKDELIDWSVELPSRTDSAELEYVERAERIDDVRVRLFFRPFLRSEERSDYARRTIRNASVILRGDLDWTPESIRESEDDSFSVQAEERRYERVDGYVVPIEILTGPVPADDTGSVLGINEHTQFAWRIDPTFELETFSANRFLAEPLLPPRDPSAWRWYRVMSAISAALFAFLIGRSVLNFVRPKLWLPGYEATSVEVAVPAEAASPADS